MQPVAAAGGWTGIRAAVADLVSLNVLARHGMDGTRLVKCAAVSRRGRSSATSALPARPWRTAGGVVDVERLRVRQSMVSALGGGALPARAPSGVRVVALGDRDCQPGRV